MPLMVGQMLYGFCGGEFGRDSYLDKRVEAVGFDWVVVREDNGVAKFAFNVDHEALIKESEYEKKKRDEEAKEWEKSKHK